MEWNARLWKNSIAELTKFMAPLVATLGRSERRRAAMHYVEGLLIPGQRKSIEPMAARLGVDSQSLQQLLTSSPWSDEALWKAIRQEVIPHLEPLEAWVVDETGWLKQGKHSVGVSHQYCGAVGKSANCQVSVELVVSEGWVAAPIAAQLYLPRSWSEDAERRAAAGVPGRDRVSHQAGVGAGADPAGSRRRGLRGARVGRFGLWRQRGLPARSAPVGARIFSSGRAHAQGLDRTGGGGA